jgi:hypothetical protein
MTRNKLYLILSIALFAGYFWAAWAIFRVDVEHSTFTPCVIKQATGIPCPSCGTTRSVSEIIRGNFIKAVFINPLGFIIAAFMILIPFWIIFDVATKKDSLYRSYIKFEGTLKIRWVAILLITLIILNWIWNIYKGL